MTILHKIQYEADQIEKNRQFIKIFTHEIIGYCFLVLGLYGSVEAVDIDKTVYLSESKGKGYFALKNAKETAPLLINSSDFPGVIRAFRDLQEDIFKVSGEKPALILDKTPSAKRVVIAGTLGKSELIEDLVARKMIDPKELAGKWEKFIIKTVKKPMPGVESALVIVGSDKRGTIFGIYDLSEQLGVSPWHWWADVPVKKKENIYIIPGTYSDGEPAVKYRGIFINDEAPALKNWAKEQFGGFNHQFYEKVFELLLWNKANYLWPAMWPLTMLKPVSNQKFVLACNA